ncbi:hypothetical protein F4679DRAFT_230604 [Xylaria curta]|nr:hypothetical protein F4679DRAFT_230604 [Xylaria curta]
MSRMPSLSFVSSIDATHDIIQQGSCRTSALCSDIRTTTDVRIRPQMCPKHMPLLFVKFAYLVTPVLLFLPFVMYLKAIICWCFDRLMAQMLLDSPVVFHTPTTCPLALIYYSQHIYKVQGIRLNQY